MSPEERFNELADDLAAQNDNVELGKMFGMPTIKRSGKAIAGFWRDSMVFKLTNEAVREQALALAGAKQFDPMGGRPMREWVVVPASHSDEWPRLAHDAL
ncbi:MAG TPA: hypothetical protein VF002_01155 [Gaiellaceae bacterium]